MSITAEKLNELEKEYGKWSSWAVWNDHKICDTAVIRNSVSELKTTIIVIGLNQSECKPNNANWFNFHVKKRGCKDTRLCQAFNNDSPVRGAYMTDLVKIQKSKGSDIDKYFEAKENLKDIKEQIKKFQSELDDVGITHDSTFILLGKQAQRYFTFFLKENFYPQKRIDLDHYSARHYKTDAEWVNYAREVINREF